MSERADWEKHKNYPPNWSWATWRERAVIVLLNIIAWGVVFPAMFIGAIWMFGMMIDGVAQRSEEHDRCMKHATNGYEIERCR